MRHSATRTKWLAVTIALGALACGKPQDKTSLRLAPVTRRDIAVSANAAGIIEPVTTIEVKSKASGEIVDVAVEEGEHVVRDQLLVKVDPRIPENAVIQAEADSVVARAQLDNAEAQLQRAETLHESQAITDLEYENARLARATAYAALVRARRALEDAKIAFEDTEVRAPTTGVILGRSVEIGTVIASASRDVSGGAVLLRMARLDTVQVRGLVDETDIGMIKPGMPVTITVQSYPNRPFNGDVLRIGAEAIIDQNVTMFPVLIRIRNEEELLRPGMNAEIEIHVGDLHDVLAVPNTALRKAEELEIAANLLGLPADVVQRQLRDAEGYDTHLPRGGADDGHGDPKSGTGGARLFGGEYVVFALRNGAPRAVPVQTGLTDYDYTAVLAGLTANDTVVILPTAGLLEEQAQRQGWINRRVGSPLGN